MKIKECRKASGLTQAELAEKLGIARATVAMWERGSNAPRGRKLPSIAAALDCTIDALFTGIK